jgi:hypothetical protein
VDAYSGDLKLVEEQRLKSLEERSSDMREKGFQVFTETHEHKPAKIRKCNVANV